MIKMQQAEVKERRGTECLSLELLKTIIQPVEQGIVLIDRRFRPFFVNKRCCDILGAEGEEQAVKIIERNCPKSVFEQSKDKRAAVTYLDIALPDRETRILLGLEIRYIDSLKEEPFYLFLMHDFSKWRKIDEVRSRFVTSLSHRMRTPLTSVRNAVKILSDEEKTIPNSDREKLLDIGWRNIEKLISHLDELQKLFMIESEDASVCRTLLRLRSLMKSHLAELYQEGRIKGFKLNMPDTMSLVGRGRLKEFITTSVDAFGKWMGSTPFIECNSSIREDFRYLGGIERKIKISLRPRFPEHREGTKQSLSDFLSYYEAHRRLVLHRLATALDGEIRISRENTISLLLPLHPEFDREKDLVLPLHMMTERAELEGREFHLASLRMIGVIDDEVRFTKMLETTLCTYICEDGIISRGEEPLSYSIFIINRTGDEVMDMMRCVHERFLRSCRESGDEIYPSIRWDIKYSRALASDENGIKISIEKELVQSGCQGTVV